GTSLYHIPFILKLDRTRWGGRGFDWTVLPTPSPGSAPRSEDYSVIETVAPNPVVADLDGDGFKEIVYPSYDGKVHAYWLDKIDGSPDFSLVVGTTSSGVVAYKLPNSASARILWGTGRGNYRRDGTAAPR